MSYHDEQDTTTYAIAATLANDLIEVSATATVDLHTGELFGSFQDITMTKYGQKVEGMFERLSTRNQGRIIQALTQDANAHIDDALYAATAQIENKRADKYWRSRRTY